MHIKMTRQIRRISGNIYPTICITMGAEPKKGKDTNVVADSVFCVFSHEDTTTQNLNAPLTHGYASHTP